MGIEHEISSIKKQQVAVTLKKVRQATPTPTSEPEIRQDISRPQQTTQKPPQKDEKETKYTLLKY